MECRHHSTENVDGRRRPPLRSRRCQLLAHRRRPNTWSAPGGAPQACQKAARAPPLLPLLGVGSPGLGLCPVAPMPVDPTLREWCCLGASGRQANSDAERVPVPEKTVSLSAGRCLAGLLGKDARGCLRTRSCAQAANPRTTGAESTLTSPRPGGVPCGRSAHTCAVLAPRGPPLPALLVPQPLLHDRCSPVDVNLPHPHRPRHPTTFL